MDGPSESALKTSLAVSAPMKNPSFQYRLIRYLVFLLRHANIDESPWAMLIGHRELRSLMNQPALRPLITHHPEIIYRIYRRYMAASLTTKSRRAILKEHYSCLLERVDGLFFVKVLQSQPTLWQENIGADLFAVRLGFTGQWHQEGDFLLEFVHNSLTLYSLSFSIAPGNLVGSHAPRTVFVGRVQGVPEQFDAIRGATKACLDLAPSFLLMAAVEGIAESLGINSIAGVRNQEQITINLEGDIYFHYDAFWQKYSVTESKVAYLIAVPIPEKSIELISTRHRGRTRAKRAFKRGITDTVKRNFGELLSGNRTMSHEKNSASR